MDYQAGIVEISSGDGHLMPNAPSVAHAKRLTYRQSGVDINAGDALVKAIRPLAAATRRPGADAELGGFGGLFDLKAAGFTDPVLVAATDGVGTKLNIAFASDRHETVGIDLVAMCVNDLIAQGAEPLFFLDYFATGRLDTGTAARVVGGIADGCRIAGCALIGGETAEMPGMYAAGHYDLAGFAVGAVERGRVLPRPDVVPGDILIGLGSDGLHSNGFSLVRRIIEAGNFDLHGPSPFTANTTLAASLLAPTRIYVGPLLSALSGGTGIKALAHITGGGITHNLPRVLPENTAAGVDLGMLPRIEVMGWLARSGPVETGEMLATFNCGIGMIAVVDPAGAAEVASRLGALGETVVELGAVRSGDGSPAVEYSGTPWWAV